MVELLRLPTELVWLVLDLATPATKVQTFYALGWFDYFWPAVFAMRMEDIMECIEAVGRKDVLSKQQARFYRCVIRNWCYRYSAHDGDLYGRHRIAEYDVHPFLFEMWMLYNDTEFRWLKDAAARAGRFENYMWLMQRYPEHILKEVEILFWAGGEKLARYVLDMKPALKDAHVSIAVPNLPLSVLNDMYETYADLFDSDHVRRCAARSCRIEVLEWLRIKTNCCVTREMVALSIASKKCSRELLQWYVKHVSGLEGGDILQDYTSSYRSVQSRFWIENSLDDCWHPELVMGMLVRRPFRQHPDLKAICKTKPFDSAAATAYCLQHNIQFTAHDLKSAPNLPVIKWMNAYNVIPPSSYILRCSKYAYDRDPAIIAWLLKERSDPIPADELPAVAAEGSTGLYAMLHDKFSDIHLSKEALLRAAIRAPFDMIKLLFRRHPYLQKREVLQWLYRELDALNGPKQSILIFLEIALQIQEPKASQKVKEHEERLLALYVDI